MGGLEYGPGTALYEKDRIDALSGYKATQRLESPSWSVMVEAQADTGSRYLVAASWLSEVQARISGGGRILVSVLQPWQNTATLDADMPVYEEWIGARLGSIERRSRGVSLHGGDVVALTCAIRDAIKLLKEASGGDAEAV